MTTFSLRIETDNAAFEDPSELPRLLRKVSMDIEDGKLYSYDEPHGIIDANGNTVGEYVLTLEQVPENA